MRVGHAPHAVVGDAVAPVAVFAIGAAVVRADDGKRGRARGAGGKQGRQRAVDAATRRLRQRPYMFMLTSRFIPLGRLSSNIAATIAGYPLQAFTVFSLVSAAIWSVYSVGIGILTQFWPGISIQVAVVIAIAVSLALGWLLGKVSAWFLDRKNPQQVPAVVP